MSLGKFWQACAASIYWMNEHLCACMHVMKVLFSPGHGSTARMTHCHFSLLILFQLKLRGGSEFISIPLRPSFSHCLSSSIFIFASHISDFFLICIQLIPAYLLCIFHSVSLYFSHSMPVEPLPVWSVRVWIIEVYWVWSADGEIAVLDLSVLFRNHWVYADTCPVKAHGSSDKAQGTAGELSQERPKKKALA